MSDFLTLKKINVNEHVEKKGNLSYLSWAWAVDQLLSQDPKATWSYSEPQYFGETMMVFCTVTAFEKSMTAQLPVMDYKNKAIPKPDAMAVNTAMQRCLAKAIALHGIGLYIYAGEDLPQDGEQEQKTNKRLPALSDEEAEKEYNKWVEVKSLLVDEEGIEDQERVIAEWGKLASNVRTGIKRHGSKLKSIEENDQQSQQHIDDIKREAA